MPRKVCILGAGKMGMQIGLEYALGGHTVACVTRRRSDAQRRLEAWIAALEDLDLVGSDDLVAAQGRTSIHVRGEPLPFAPDLFVESLPEEMSLKVGALRASASEFSEAVIASNTSSLSITELGRAIGAEPRTLGTHYLNPALLMPLVEVIPGADTSQDVISDVLRILRQLGKQPVQVNAEVAGFVWNRLQFALIREAVSLVEGQVVAPEMIDEILRRGLARRWRATGLFGTVALGGVQTFIQAGANILPSLSDQSTVEGLEDIVDAMAIEELEATRNQLLAADLLADRRRDGGK